MDITQRCLSLQPQAILQYLTSPSGRYLIKLSNLAISMGSQTDRSREADRGSQKFQHPLLTVASTRPKSVSSSPGARSQQATYRSGHLRTMNQEPAPAIQDLCSRQYMAPRPVYSVVLILQLGACREYMSVNAVDLLSGFQRKLFPIRLFSHNTTLNHYVLILFLVLILHF